MLKKLLAGILIFTLTACENKEETQVKTDKKESPFIWEGANVYFLLTDRFNNGDTSNDVNFQRNESPGKLRGFEGGDIKGVIQRL